jgi:hypothetical protein
VDPGRHQVAASGVDARDVAGAAHAAEHAAIGLLPLFATATDGTSGGCHGHAPRYRAADRLRLRRSPWGRRLRRARFRGRSRLADDDPRRHRELCMSDGLPVVRAVSEVRQRQRAAGQAGLHRSA